MARTCTGARLRTCCYRMEQTSITSLSRMAGAGGIGSMRLGTPYLRAWKKMHEKRRKDYGLILLPSRRGSIGKQGEGNRLTFRTCFCWMLVRKIAHLLAVLQHSKQ